MRILILVAISFVPAYAGSAPLYAAPVQGIALVQTVDFEDTEELRGALLGAEQLGIRSRDEIAAALADEGIPGVPQYGVVLYRVLYKTVDHEGMLREASGAVAIPLTLDGPAPLLSYQHGSVSARRRVPSAQGFDLVSMGLSGSGYVTALPDYLGLGASDTFHPYVHAATLGTSVVDFLRATRLLCAQLDIPLSEQLFLVGYSEGGYATMAAHREIEAHHTDEFTVTASAPMAGPYNLSDVMVEQMLEDKPYPTPGYLPFTLVSYDRVYDLFDDLSDVLREPYANAVDSLFNGNYALREINEHLPSVPRDMLTDNFVAALREKTHPLQKALAENDVHNWAPVAPMRLFHCVDDDQVSFRNAEKALAAFQAHGADHVELAALEFGGHESCAPPALFLGKLWLDGFRAGQQAPMLQANIKIIKSGTF
ncbi:MAG: lipase family protein [Bacteroidota bacterium]